MIVKRKREDLGISQEELAKAMGVDQSTVSLWETGKTLPRAKLLPKLASLLKCTVDEIVKSATAN